MKDLRIEFPSAGATYARDEYGVYEYSEYPESSVLAGQERRQFLDSFETLEAARAAYPDAVESGCGYQPPFLGHLPDDGEDEEYAFGGGAAADNHAEEIAERANDSAGSRKASRAEQHERYLDCGPQAWDDRGDV